MRRLIAVDHEACTGCKTCELVCSLFHLGQFDLERSAIRVMRKEERGLVLSVPLVCQQCEPAPCIEVCATEAISRESEHGALIIDEEKCSACGECVSACPIGCIFVDSERGTAVSCDLCGGQPQCVAFCHSHCLTYDTYDISNERHGTQHLLKVLDKENLWAIMPGGRDR